LIAHLQYGCWCTEQSLQLLHLKLAFEKVVLYPEQVWHCLLGQEKPQTASGSNISSTEQPRSSQPSGSGGGEGISEN
jgi:hypothetical protein